MGWSFDCLPEKVSLRKGTDFVPQADEKFRFLKLLNSKYVICLDVDFDVTHPTRLKSKNIVEDTLKHKSINFDNSYDPSYASISQILRWKINYEH